MQTGVNIYPCRGCNGAFAGVNPTSNAFMGFKAGVGGVNVGTFVWEDTSNEGQVLNAGVGVPVGLVVREQVNPILSVGVQASEKVEKGYPTTIAVNGDFYVKVASAVTKGQRVFAKLADGSLKGGAKGATVADYVETPWMFIQSAGANEIAVISNHGNDPVISLNVATGTIPYGALADKFTTMPTAGAEYADGKVYQFIGTTGGGYTHGYFYQCTESGGTYSWSAVTVQA